MKRPPSLLEIIGQSADREWMQEALCASPDISRDVFFPDEGENTRKAKAICKRCSVTAECLAYALAIDTEDSGVWGGTSETERRKLRKQIKKGKS